MIPVQAAGGFFDAVPFDTANRSNPQSDTATYAAPATGYFLETDVSGTLMKHNGAGPGETQNPSYVRTNMSVRRLTPTECERLQGFPDGHTLIPWKGKPAADCPDGPRHKALGNSMAVPVIRWSARKIEGAMP